MSFTHGAYIVISLHWLPLSQRVQHRVAALVSLTLSFPAGSAPPFACVTSAPPMSVSVARRMLRSTESGEPLVQRGHV